MLGVTNPGKSRRIAWSFAPRHGGTGDNPFCRGQAPFKGVF